MAAAGGAAGRRAWPLSAVCWDCGEPALCPEQGAGLIAVHRRAERCRTALQLAGMDAAPTAAPRGSPGFVHTALPQRMACPPSMPSRLRSSAALAQGQPVPLVHPGLAGLNGAADWQRWTPHLHCCPYGHGHGQCQRPRPRTRERQPMLGPSQSRAAATGMPTRVEPAIRQSAGGFGRGCLRPHLPLPAQTSPAAPLKKVGMPAPHNQQPQCALQP